MFVTEEAGGQRIFDIEEAIALAFYLLWNDDVGDIYTVDGQRGLATFVGCGETAEDGKTVGIGRSVEERVLHVSASLGIAIGLVTERSGMRVGRIVVFVSRLVLLFTRRDEVDGALGERFGLALCLCHVAMGVALGSLLIPITRVAGVVDCGKRLQHETGPVVACYAWTAYVQREAECGQVTLADTG